MPPSLLTIGGLSVHVYGLSDLSPASPAVSVCFVLHGRMGSVAQMHGVIDNLHKRLSAQSNHPILLCAFDQRNHGHRLVDRTRNLAWREFVPKNDDQGFTNPSHAVDMYAIQSAHASVVRGPTASDDVFSLAAGTALDVSFLIDFLPSALFPDDAHAITQWACLGVSLGGHSAWLAASKDPRLSVVVPVIGSPSLIDLLSKRAADNGMPLAPPYLPNSLRQLCQAQDPIYHPEAFQGKHLLVLCGATDQLVPCKQGGTEAFVQTLKDAGEDVELVVEPGAGHIFSPKMQERAAAFLASKLSV